MPEIVPPHLRAFLDGKTDSADFRHADHVRIGFELLRRHAFDEAASAFCTRLRDMAARAGKPGAYHATISFAFLSVIAERSAAFEDFESFARANPDLMEKSVLTRWYAPERLSSALARQTFILPGPVR
jgi:hypothetical protein